MPLPFKTQAAGIPRGKPDRGFMMPLAALGIAIFGAPSVEAAVIMHGDIGNRTPSASSTLTVIGATPHLNPPGMGDITADSDSFAHDRPHQAHIFRADESPSGDAVATLSFGIADSYSPALPRNGDSQLDFQPADPTAKQAGDGDWEQNWEIYGESTGSIDNGDLSVKNPVSLVMATARSWFESAPGNPIGTMSGSDATWLSGTSAFSVVPEPAGALLVGFGSLLVLRRRR